MLKFYKVKSISSRVEKYKIPFGKFRGERLQFVKHSYLQWLKGVLNNRLDRVIIEIYLDASEKYFDGFPEHIDPIQLTKWMMAKREKELNKRREETCTLNECDILNENKM